jgi:hypothetical protein
MKNNWLNWLAVALFVLWQWYLSMPVFGFGFVGWPMMAVAAGILLVLLGLRGLKPSAGRRMSVPSSAKFGLALAIGAGLYLAIGGVFTTWSGFHAQKYRNLVGEVEVGESFAKDVQAIPLNKIRIVDQRLADRLGDKVMGAQPSLGSQAKLGTFNIQNVNGEFLWVAPLLHSGIFKWYSNQQGTPGYVVVSATNERDVRLVQEVGGKPVHIKYQPNAYGLDYLERHLYLNGYMAKGLTDFTFEINDLGHPYWVVTIFERKIGFGGDDATGVVVVDAMTGEMKEYAIADAPAWVDRIQPQDLVQEQLDDWGEYVHGWWNPSNRDKLMTTRGMSLVYDQNNRSYWFTGLTSVGADEGTVGFVLVDTRSKAAIWYKQIGATEQAAMVSAMGKVQEKGYDSSFPITYNINGVPTYVMALKDQAGLVKMVAMVSVQDYSIVAVGNDVQECARSYKNALNSTGNSIGPQSTSTRLQLRAVVERLAADVRAGQTYYYLTLEGYPQKLFIGTSGISPELPITQARDSVLLGYDDAKPSLIDIVSFDNLQLQPIKTDSASVIVSGAVK